MKPITRERIAYIWDITKQGPTEFGYAYFRARRRKKNRKDDEPEISESDQIGISSVHDFTSADLERNARLLASYERAERLEVRSIQWFLPFFAHAYFGGVYTILRFADHFAREHGVENRFCVYDVPERIGRRVPDRIAAAFPSLAGAEVTFAEDSRGGPRLSKLRECDAAIATLWTSAYPLLRFDRTKAKLYFVQDFEPQFYPAGSASALAEETYRFGFPGIVNTPGLADAYRAYGNPAVSFVPAVDAQRYHPPAEPRPREPVRVFFYGRPWTPRNAFGLGLASLAKVKDRYGDRVEVVCAGETWDPGQFGVADRIQNLGRLPDFDAVARLYRSCHIGLALMLTKHPSYQPFEFMASGIACVSNENPHTAWFLEHERNALLAPPAATPMADQIGRLVEDAELRDRLVAKALEGVLEIRWEDQIERVWRALTKQDDAFRAGVVASSAPVGQP